MAGPGNRTIQTDTNGRSDGEHRTNTEGDGQRADAGLQAISALA